MKSVKLLLKLGAAGLSALGLWMNFGTETGTITRTSAVTVPRHSSMLERATTLAEPGALGHRYRGNEQNVTASETDETESTESSEPGIMTKDPRPVSPIAAPEVRLTFFTRISVAHPILIYANAPIL